MQSSHTLLSSPRGTRAIPPRSVVESESVAKSIREPVENAIESLGLAVTVGDVAAAAGVKLSDAERAMTALAADTGAALEVSSEGDLLYVFDAGFRSKVRSIQKFFTHRPVSTFDRVPFQLTDELFLYGMALRFSLNGGVETDDDAVRHLSSGKLKGVMLGRAVYRDPTILHDVDARVYGDESGGVGVDPTVAKSRGDALTRYE